MALGGEAGEGGTLRFSISSKLPGEAVLGASGLPLQGEGFKGCFHIQM